MSATAPSQEHVLIRPSRLFSPATSDDASHDEALSSRVAAMNMVDLGLEHLGVDIGKAGADVEAVTRACGESRYSSTYCNTMLIAFFSVINTFRMSISRRQERYTGSRAQGCYRFDI